MCLTFDKGWEIYCPAFLCELKELNHKRLCQVKLCILF